MMCLQKKRKLSKPIKTELSGTMQQFGFDFIKHWLLTLIQIKVKHSMNEINAAKRMKESKEEQRLLKLELC